MRKIYVKKQLLRIMIHVILMYVYHLPVASSFCDGCVGAP